VSEVFDPPQPDTLHAVPAWAPPEVPEPTKAARRPISGLLPKTLTGRLVAGLVALVIVVVAVLGTSTYLALRAFLYDRLEKQVAASASQNGDQVRRSFAESTGSGITLISAGSKLWFSIVESDGSQLPVPVPPSLSSQFVNLHLSSSEVQALITHPGSIRSISGSGETLRASAVRVSGGSFVVIGLSTAEVERTLHRLIVLELAIGAAAVAMAAGLTAWGVRVGLRPLHRVTRTAQEVTAELGPDGAGLDRRVPDTDPTTEVGRVASSVNTLLGAVQTEFAARVRSEDRMRQFLADASHELRTPLTSIRGYAELSRLQGHSTNSPEDPMRRIEVEGTRMSRLVEDLLVLARGDDQSSEVRREPVDVDGLLRDALSSVESAHPEREMTMLPSGGAVVLGDRDQLLRLLLNLLNNAAGHTAPEGAIRLEGVRGSTPAGPAVALRVIDAGPGLTPEEAAHVFERFWRADKARTRARGGSGLGMAIVAQIAYAHEGTVSFDSDVEAGTTVTVTLPMITDSAPPGTRMPPGP
jgi:two-component system OmpR family sensor kinase